MKEFNLLEDSEPTSGKRPDDLEEEITPDTLDELIQARDEPAPSEAAVETSEEDTAQETEEETSILSTEEEETGYGESRDDFENTFPKKRVFLIVGIVLALVLGGVVLFMWLSSSEEVPTAEVPAAPQPASEAKQTATPEPAIDPALVRRLAENTAFNQTVTRVVNTVFATRTGAAAPVLIVSEGNNLVVTIKAASMDEAAKYRIQLKEKFPALTIASMGKSVSATEKNGYWDLAIPLSVGSAASGNEQADVIKPTQFQSALQQLAQRNGLQNINLQKGPVYASAGFRNQVYYLKMKGRVNSVIAFLNQITTDFPAARINKVRIGYPNFKTNTNVAEAQIDLYLLIQ